MTQSIMSIDGFKAQIGDILRPNLFYVTINDGGARDGANFTNKSDLAFYANAASLPASSVSPVDVAFMGRSLRVAGNRTFADWNITVYSDIGSVLRKEFEIWSSGVNTHPTNLGHNRIRNYLRIANVYQLDQMGNEIVHYELNDVWPNNIGEIQLAWSNNNQVESFQVTLTVGTYWVREVTPTGNQPVTYDGASRHLGDKNKAGDKEAISSDGGARTGR